jgi:hypothetical protein
MGHVANAIGWLTVAITAGIVSRQVAYLLSADSIANQLPIKPLIDMTSAVMLPTARKGSVLACDSFRIAYHEGKRRAREDRGSGPSVLALSKLRRDARATPCARPTSHRLLRLQY